MIVESLLRRYEQDFFRFDFCRSKKNLEHRLSEGFIEIGMSGSCHSREDVIRSLSALTCDRPIEILKFTCEMLSPKVCLVRYISCHIDKNACAHRTSVWRQEAGEWKLYFHQGTPCSSSL